MSLKIVSRSLPNAGRGYSPAGEGPFPAVLLLHGSAAILAAHGFLAIPFGYSNGGNHWNAGDIINVPLNRTAEALAAACARAVGQRDRVLRRVARRRTRLAACLADGTR
jgi:hypothetical protein